MRDPVRVKDPTTGAQFTTSRANAKRIGAAVLDKPAVDAFGKPLATKYPSPITKAAPKPADTPKEG